MRRGSSGVFFGALLVGFCVLGLAALAPLVTAKTKVEFWTWNDLPGQLIAEAADEFNDTRPDVQIDVKLFPIDGYFDKVMAAAAGNALPHIVRSGAISQRNGGGLFPNDMYSPSLLEYMQSQPLTFWQELANSDGVDTLPWVLWVPSFWYRPSLYEEAGLAGPPTTWDQLRNYSQKLTVTDSTGRTKRWGFVVAEDNLSYSFIPQAAPTFYKSKQTTVSLKAEEVQSAYRFAYDLIYTYKVAPWPLNTWNGGYFIEGNAASITIGTWMLGNMINWKPNIDWDVALPPTPKPGTPYGLTVVATDLHIRASLTKAERDAAVAFLKVVYGREFSSKLALKTGLVPPGELVPIFVEFEW